MNDNTKHAQNETRSLKTASLSLEELRALDAAEGVASLDAEITRVRNRAAQEVAERERWFIVKWFARIDLRGILYAIETTWQTLGALFRTLVLAGIKNVGGPVLVVILWIAEMLSSSAAFSLLDAYNQAELQNGELVPASVEQVGAVLAGVGGWISLAIVTAYFVLSLRLVELLREKGEKTYAWSFRTTWNSLRYLFALPSVEAGQREKKGKAIWKPNEVTKAQRLRKGRRWGMVAVFFLGMVGRMGGLLLTQVNAVDTEYLGRQSILFYVALLVGPFVSLVLLSLTHFVIDFMVDEEVEAQEKRAPFVKQLQARADGFDNYTARQLAAADKAERRLRMSKRARRGKRQARARQRELSATQTQVAARTERAREMASHGNGQ